MNSSKLRNVKVASNNAIEMMWKKSFGYLLIALCSVFSLSSVSYACGTINNWVDVYNTKGPMAGHVNKKQALVGLYICPVTYYSGEASDRIIFPVVVDALRNIQDIEKQETHETMDRKQLLNASGGT